MMDCFNDDQESYCVEFTDWIDNDCKALILLLSLVVVLVVILLTLCWGWLIGSLTIEW